jgi:hypothetical protein
MKNITIENDNFKQIYIMIKQSEYRRIKNADPANVHGYTARIGFKYFIKMEKIIPDEKD